MITLDLSPPHIETIAATRHCRQGDEAMLVLSRKKNESIIIDDHITITVVEIRGDKVRLGIEAPKEISVHRREVFEAIQNQARRLAEETAADGFPPRRT